MTTNHYDIIIIGGGPAGLTAALYAARAGRTVAVIEKSVLGGAAALTHWIDNYPGFPDGINGYDLGELMSKQAVRFGAEILYGTVEKAVLSGKVKKIFTDSGTFTARAVILSMGTSPRLLGVEDEAGYLGRGLSYCATCDGAFFKGKDVAVIGGGNTAFSDLLYLARLCNKVYLVHRREGFRAEKVLVDKASALSNAEFALNYTIGGIITEGNIKGLSLTSTAGGAEKEIAVSGVFAAVGSVPATAFLEKIKLTNDGYIIVKNNMKTNLAGVFACGDITDKPLRQVVTACSDGAVAAEYAVKFLE